jgi:hypothetical protein
MSTHQHDRSNQHQSNQHSQNEANKTAPSAADQDRSHGSHTGRANQSGKGAEKPQNDMSAQKSSGAPRANIVIISRARTSPASRQAAMPLARLGTTSAPRAALASSKNVDYPRGHQAPRGPRENVRTSPYPG